MDDQQQHRDQTTDDRTRLRVEESQPPPEQPPPGQQPGQQKPGQQKPEGEGGGDKPTGVTDRHGQPLQPGFSNAPPAPRHDEDDSGRR